jgi:hypothetical protein
MPSSSRINVLKATAASVVAAAVVAAPAAAVAAPSAATAAASPSAKKLSPPFTLGLSDYKVKPGQYLNVSGLANARAGLPLTIMSNAISSSRSVNGVPAITTPALVEGIYKARVRVPPALKPGVYSVKLRFNNRQVASVNNLRVIAKSSKHGGATGKGCAGIGFTVLNNDHAGVAYLPAGAYNVSSRSFSCASASQKFTAFLALAGKPMSGWKSSSSGTGRGTFTQKSNGQSFSVAKK